MLVRRRRAYRSAADPVALVPCHCRDCQRCTSGPFAPVAVVMAEALQVVKGQTHVYRATGPIVGICLES